MLAVFFCLLASFQSPRSTVGRLGRSATQELSSCPLLKIEHSLKIDTVGPSQLQHFYSSLGIRMVTNGMSHRGCRFLSAVNFLRVLNRRIPEKL